MSQVILFEHKEMHGAHKHLFASEPNLNAPDDNFFNDRLSSFVIVSGQWQFFEHADYQGAASAVFGPGVYHWVEDVGIKNDSVSSVKKIAEAI